MAKGEEVFCWARYVVWCELLKKHHDALVEKSQEQQAQQDDPHDERTFAAMSYWYGSLYVVIEGWEALGLHDPVIDALLAHKDNFKGLLRRYRNATFHFSSDLIDPRMVEMLRFTEMSVLWTTVLHSEFVRYLDFLVNAVSFGDKEDAAFKEDMRGIIGWLPEDDNPVRKAHATIAKMETILRRNPDWPEEDKAKLRADIEEARVGLRDGVAALEALKESWLAKLLGGTKSDNN